MDGLVGSRVIVWRTGIDQTKWIRIKSICGCLRFSIISCLAWRRCFRSFHCFTRSSAAFSYLPHGIRQPPDLTRRRITARISRLDFYGDRLAIVLLGIAIAICILIAGRSLAKHRHYWFAFAIACVECLFIPFGTILGVFTIIVLLRESVKALFAATQTSV